MSELDPVKVEKAAGVTEDTTLKDEQTQPSGETTTLPSTEGADSKPTKAGGSQADNDIGRILGGKAAEDFDWQEYEAGYTGRALITRLSHVYTSIISSPNPPPAAIALARAAIDRLIPLVKSTWDASTYIRATTALADPPIKGSRPLASRADLAAGGSDGQQDHDMDSGPSAVNASASASARAGASRESKGFFDIEWVETSKEAERREMARLDTELKGYSSNLIRESMRLTYLAFAQIALKSGKIGDILKSYANAREYSSAPPHYVELGVGILEACLAFNQPLSLPGHLAKLETALERAYPSPDKTATGPAGTGTATGGSAGASAPTTTRDAASMTAADLRDAREREQRVSEVRAAVGVKLRVARGLVALASKDWDRAGRELGVALREGLKEWDGKAITTSDLALCAAICTLATGTRNRIRTTLLEETAFRVASDDGQRWLVDLVRAYLDADYTALSGLLKRAESPLLLNPFLAPHTTILLRLIRTSAIIQYVRPFSSVKLSQMQSAFGMTENQVLGEVERLVENGRIEARLDLVDGVLEMKQPDTRRELFATALEVGRESSKTSQAALLRIRLLEARIFVENRSGSNEGGGKGKGGGGGQGTSKSHINAMIQSGVIDVDESDEGYGGGAGEGERGGGGDEEDDLQRALEASLRE